MSFFKAFRRDEAGATIVEAAFIMPLIMFTAVGMLQMGIYFLGVHSAKQATEEAGREARLINSPDEETIKRLLIDELKSPIAGRYAPNVTIISDSESGDRAEITVDYTYVFGLPSADGKSPFSLNMKATANTQVMLRDLPELKG